MTRPKLPPWIRVRIKTAGDSEKVRQILGAHDLNTVCQSAKCPNLAECWHKQTATFMILGSRCTRNCRFCAVEHNRQPSPPSPSEAGNLAKAVLEMNLAYVVITSVTRDDLSDGGASCFVAAIREIRKLRPATQIEVLTPDFKGDRETLKKIIDAAPTVFNHNLETVERLTSLIRSGAEYRRSLFVLKTAFELSSGKIPVKSGIMVGLGETDREIENSIADIRESGTEILTIGQYLPPTEDSWELDRYVHPDQFDAFRDFALGIGFKSVASGPLVRSSYHAEQSFKNIASNIQLQLPANHANHAKN